MEASGVNGLKWFPCICEQKSEDNHRSELDVYGVIEGNLPLQVLQLLHVLAAAGLHHVLEVKHSWLSTAHNDHRAEVWQSDRRDQTNADVGERSVNALVKLKVHDTLHAHFALKWFMTCLIV